MQTQKERNTMHLSVNTLYANTICRPALTLTNWLGKHAHNKESITSEVYKVFHKSILPLLETKQLKFLGIWNKKVTIVKANEEKKHSIKKGILLTSTFALIFFGLAGFLALSAKRPITSSLALVSSSAFFLSVGR